MADQQEYARGVQFAVWWCGVERCCLDNDQVEKRYSEKGFSVYLFVFFFF